MSDDNDDNGASEPFRLIGYDIAQAVAIARDDEALKAAYQKVFGSVDGKAVLFDLMAEVKVLEARPAAMPALERTHHDGRVSLASYILDRAGVSSLERVAGLQAAVTLNTHMERAHDRPSDPGAGGGPGGDTHDGTESDFD